MKKLISMLAIVSLMLFALTGCDSKKGDNSTTTTEDTRSTTSDASETSDNSTDSTYPPESEMLSGLHHAEIDIKDYGVIKLELDADKAPITVTNFVLLAKSGFYDGLTFHRIISGFMIQGGDPEGTGLGGSENTIYGEFLSNGYSGNTISHERGVISMARTAVDYNSASSQFFIMHEDYTGLDGDYAAFGYVTEGMEIVDKICEDATPTDSNGTIPAEEQPVINSITIID